MRRPTNKVSKNFGEGDTKIKARFSNEWQAQRVAVLFQYVHLFVEGGGKIEQVRDVLTSDIDKCLEVLGKIQTKHPRLKEYGNPPECPEGTKLCEVSYSVEHDQWRCSQHGLLYKDGDGFVAAAA